MSVAYAAIFAGPAEIMEPAAGRELQRPRSTTDAEQEPRTILLRNRGGRPLRLQATLLAEGGNRQPGVTHWHEMALYRTDAGQIAVALRLLSSLPGECGVHRARVFGDIDAACGWLEQFDVAADLDAGFDVADQRLSGPGLAVEAASLRGRAERLDRAYRGLVGEILFHLEQDS